MSAETLSAVEVETAVAASPPGSAIASAVAVPVPGVGSLGTTEAAAIAVGVVLAVVLLAAVRRLLGGRSRGERFREALREVDEVSVLLHPNPDPDAMACGIAVADLARRSGTAATVQYPGRVGHQENRAFRTVLDLEMDRIDAAGDLAAEAVVLVDHPRPRGFDGAEDLEPYAVVDHHDDDPVDAPFVDVRPEYGACASLVAEYLRDLDAPVVGPDAESNGQSNGDAPASGDGGANGGDRGAGGAAGDGTAALRVPSRVATGLAYGVLSDTDRLTRGAGPPDFAACQYLYPGIDADRLDRIANPSVDAEVLDVKGRAIRDRDVDPPYAVADVGAVGNADAIPQAADELLRLEAVGAVVVYGTCDGTVHLSGRSRDDRVHMGDCLDRVVDGVPDAGAGGHARMGGGQIPERTLRVGEPPGGVTVDRLHRRLFAAMRGDL